MRVLEIAPPWFTVPPSGYGGIELVVAALTDGLVDAGHEVTLVATGGSRTRARLVSAFDTPPTRFLGDPWLEAVQALAGYERCDEVDVIHDHTGAVGPAIAAALGGRPPVVHTLHGQWTPAAGRFHRAISDRVSLVAISHDQASRAPAGVRVAGVVHNGLDVSRYPYRADKEDLLLFVGRASADKGPDVAAEVARKLGTPLAMAVKVNEPDEQRFDTEVLRPLLEGLDVDLRYNAPHGEKVALMARARALLVPISWDEPFGMVMVEAMACGTPVVAFARGAAPEIVSDGVTGALVEPGDLLGLIDAVESVGGIDPAACRARVEERFSTARMVAGYEAVFRQVTG